MPTKPNVVLVHGAQRTPESCRTENQTATRDRITVDTAFLE